MVSGKLDDALAVIHRVYTSAGLQIGAALSNIPLTDSSCTAVSLGHFVGKHGQGMLADTTLRLENQRFAV